ncbi:MAG: 3-dehydroquinate synthase [Tissierellaceae bacterium]|nr:3-dehydroquinate synthase [Tissierellaceae bacterium]
MEKIVVNLSGNSYDIHIGKGILVNIDDFIEPNNEQNFLISDENVYELYGHYFENLKGYEKIIVKPGEQSKSLETVSHILGQMLGLKGSRKSKVIAFGGGVVGDLGGFCSSIYMRGIEYIQIPTTILAQVDSSIGGKTGVNFQNHKNTVGTFHQPSKVIVDIDLLQSLDRRQILNGLGEIIKYGIIYDYEFFKYVKENIEGIGKSNSKVMSSVIKRCCEIKSEIVSKDEKEQNLRKILNFGHTFGHGLESITNFLKYNHGEAVIIGMYYETLLAKRLGAIDSEYFQEIMDFLNSLRVDLNVEDYPAANLIDIMANDKKNHDGKISFILPTERGKVEEYLLHKSQVKW